MSKILLVNPSYNYPTRKEMYPSGALMLLGTMAKQHGHDVKIIHMVADKQSIKDVLLITNEYRADIVGITVNTFQVGPTKQLLSTLKALSFARLVIGGPHPTSVGIDEARIEFPEADDIICGEGEHQFISILNGANIDKPQDLEYIAPPDLSLIDVNKFTGAYPLRSNPTMFMMASRGCPGQCTYCNRSIFGNKVRYRSPENVLKEIRYLAKCGMKEVFIQDDTFNINKDWYGEILQRIIFEGLNNKMRFRTPFRADEKLVDSKMLKLAKNAGFWLLFYGVESGNQGMLDRMNKRLSLDEIERAVRLTKEAGIKVETSFIVGLPGETRQTAEDTVKFYHKLSPFWSGCGIAIPFPSTDLYNEIKPQLNGLSFDNYQLGMVYSETSELNKKQIKDIHCRLNWLMILGKVKSMQRHPNILIRTIRDRVS